MTVKVKQAVSLLMITILLLTGCSSKGQIMDGDGMMNSYTSGEADAKGFFVDKRMHQA